MRNKTLGLLLVNLIVILMVLNADETSLFNEYIEDHDFFVSIYDDFDDGSYGRSEYRSVFRTVKFSAFSRTESGSVASPAWEKESHLTALVLSALREEELRKGEYAEFVTFKDGIYHFSRDGLEFSFSLEKAGSEVLQLIYDYYQGEHAHWLESVLEHYKENFIIRIHSAENIFEPWREVIQYNEALLMATLLGDEDQWLWGIHNGRDILNLY